jgi:hypothetical protein
MSLHKIARITIGLLGITCLVSFGISGVLDNTFIHYPKSVDIEHNDIVPYDGKYGIVYITPMEHYIVTWAQRILLVSGVLTIVGVIICRIWGVSLKK